MTIAQSIRQIVGQKETIETATVTAVDGTTAKVQRVGQTNSTKYLPVADGVTVQVNDVVQVLKLNDNINTGLITAVVR